MTVNYRRPVPLLAELSFDITRSEVDGIANSTVRLCLGDDVLCLGEVVARAIPSQRTVEYTFGVRRGGTAASP